MKKETIQSSKVGKSQNQKRKSRKTAAIALLLIVLKHHRFQGLQRLCSQEAKY